MALKKNILNNYFKVPEKKEKKTSIIQSQLDTNSNVSTETSNGPKFYRIFDDPTRLENLGQTQDKDKTKLGQNSDKDKTKLGQKTHLKNKTSDKLRTQPRTHSRTNLGQTQDKLRTKSSFFTLIGLQRLIALFVYDCCKQSRDKITMPLSIEHIAKCCKTTKLSAQKTIQRLEKKQIILRSFFKIGRGGWTQYELPEIIYQEILQTESTLNIRTNLGQTQDKLRSEPRTQLRTTDSCSSSININNTTTTDPEIKAFPSEWDAIDFSPLQKRNIRFGVEQLKQIYPCIKKYSALDLQESIDAFVHDLDSGKTPQFRTGPLNFLLGIYKAGNLYVSESYISPEKKLILEMAERAEKKQKEMDEANFSLWFDAQDLTTLEHKLPPDVRVDFKVRGQRWKEWIKQNIYLKEKLTNH